MSLFRDPKTFVRRGSAAAPTLRQFVRIIMPAPGSVLADRTGSAVPAIIPNAANEDRVEPLSDSTDSAEA